MATLPALDSSIDLRAVRVRPTWGAREHRRWDRLVEEHHYLAFHGVIGKGLRHVAVHGEIWLALIGWQPGAFKLGARDRWIGWSAEQQFRRLHLIANNSRFVILTPERVPNLASRVLGLSLRRLSADMQAAHGYPALLAEMGGMTPSVSTLQRLTQSMHERWESIAPETLASIRAAEDIPADAVSASVSLDGVMVALRAGEGGCAEACWREASCGTVSFHDAKGNRMKTLYLGRMPESGKVRLKAQLASEVAHIRRVRPEIRIGAVADGAADNWTFLESLSPETEVIDFWHACEHLRVASDHAVAPHWFEKHREILRHDPRGVAKVIRALCYLRDSAKGDRAEIERELAYFRKHRHRMRYHALKEEGVAIGSGVVEAACKTLVVQRLKRSGMRWRIVGGQAVLTFRALIKSGLFDQAWAALMAARSEPANDNISPPVDLAIAA